MATLYEVIQKIDFCHVTSWLVFQRILSRLIQAAANLGLRCVFACDIDEAACKQYKENFGFEPERDIYDVMAVDIPDHDLLFAGFPCQPFSIIGDRKGVKDSRGLLAFEIIRT